MPAKKAAPVNDPRAEWWGMPAFKHIELRAKRKLIVHFANDNDRTAFSELIGQPITDRTRSIWFPKAQISPHGIYR